MRQLDYRAFCRKILDEFEIDESLPETLLAARLSRSVKRIHVGAARLGRFWWYGHRWEFTTIRQLVEKAMRWSCVMPVRRKERKSYQTIVNRRLLWFGAKPLILRKLVFVVGIISYEIIKRRHFTPFALSDFWKHIFLPHVFSMNRNWKKLI